MRDNAGIISQTCIVGEASPLVNRAKVSQAIVLNCIQWKGQKSFKSCINNALNSHHGMIFGVADIRYEQLNLQI